MDAPARLSAPHANAPRRIEDAAGSVVPCNRAWDRMADAPIDEPRIRDEPRYLEKEGRNSFYESLSGEAKDRFLSALKLASSRGLDEETAWQEAVVAAETTYPPDENL